MARRRPSLLLSLIMPLLLLGSLLAAYFVYHRFLPRSPTADPAASQPVVWAREAGPALSLADSDQPLELGYLQQFCPDQPDPAAPGLCQLEAEQAEALATAISPESLACWQQIYDYAFGPLADQPYFGGQPPADPEGGEGDSASPAEAADCHQGAITVLVNPGFASQLQADNNDAARYQDILFVIAAIIEYEAYRGQPPTNWSQLDGMVNFSYYDPANVNLPGTWDAHPATTGAIPSLTTAANSPDQLAVDPETKQLPPPTSGRWGDADRAGDPQLLLLLHKAACSGDSDSPVELAGLRRYAAVYKPAAEEGFACHDF